MSTITKKDLIEHVAENLQVPRRDAKRIIQAFLEEMINELGKNNRLEFRDFGIFQCRSRPARIAQNPKTLDRVSVPTRRKVHFKAGRLMKERINATIQATNSQPAASQAGNTKPKS